MQPTRVSLRLLVCTIPLVTLARTAIAQHTSSQDTNSTIKRSMVIPLHNGHNKIDLLANGDAGEVIVSRRENFNAHGHSIALFQVLARNRVSPTTKPVWQLVPFFGGPGDPASGRDLTGTSEGADCTLQDIRLVRRARGSPVEIVIGERELGKSFADSAPVRFEFYGLMTNADGVPGWPAYYFKHTRTARAAGTYCDVDDAFDKELNLGPAGILKWAGPP
ncbi:MAG: hypothetical protein M3R65_02895 [Gemmatimonadota bacterium]|nr:hypothetical protein [Gemmatimonadota bacterium]